MRFTQVKKLGTLDALLGHLEGLGISIPVDVEVDPTGALAAPLQVRDAARTLEVPNRLAVLADGGLGRHHRRSTDGPRPAPVVEVRRRRVRARLG
jgi:hypothetical protein